MKQFTVILSLFTFLVCVSGKETVENKIREISNTESSLTLKEATEIAATIVLSFKVSPIFFKIC